MKPFSISAEAERDLNAVWDYIANDSVDAADRWIQRLAETFQILADSPGIGRVREDLTLLPVRFWPVGEYVVIYRVKTGLVEIVAVTQGSRDIPTFLRRSR